MTILNSIFFYFYIASDKIIFANFLEQILKYILLIFFILILFFLKIEIKNNHIILLYFLVNSFIFLIFISLIINNLQTFPNVKKKILEYANYTKYIFITGITSFCTVINSKIDLLVIDYFLDKTQASLYGVASQLSFIMFLPGIVFVNILMQKTALLIRNKKIKQLNILIDFYRFLLFTISLSFLFIIIFFFEKITILLFTENYLDSYIVFKILAISSLVVTFFSLNDLLLFYSGKEKKILALAFFGVIINILLSFILVPEFGITGSAISLSSSNIFVSLGIFLINLKNNYFFTYAYQILLKKKLWLIKKL
jgi:O-antigen/teichoic acid export membrane protein